MRGPQVKEFQEHLENYLGISRHPMCKRTNALQIALMGLGLKKEVRLLLRFHICCYS